MWLRLLLVIISLLQQPALAQDNAYYYEHPEKLKQAVIACKVHTAPDCESLLQLAHQINDLAYKLSIDPQSYGQDILKLQMHIAELRAANWQNTEKKIELEQAMQQLVVRLMVVKLLESPN